MIDVLTSITISKVSPYRNVSVNLSTEYLSTSKLGDELRIETWIKKHGKTLAFTDCEIYCKEKLIAKGTHIKAFLGEQWAKL